MEARERNFDFNKATHLVVGGGGALFEGGHMHAIGG